MSLAEHAELLGPALMGAIERKGYADLTAVQLAVLDPALAGRDLRITSQTGSGKTLAIGLTLRALASEEAPTKKGVACPRALVVAPTRELAHQVEQELTWLYAGSGVRLATTTGGASYRDEHRALAKGPTVVVGTPGRLLDHLERGSIDASQVGTVVLDEADRMLDLGFREDLEQLFKSVPQARSTHLVSATFPRIVRTLADRLQRDPAHVEGTRLGEANADIDHVIYVVDPHQRLDALINLLLAHPHDQTLVFVRTRADAAHIANELVVCGFAASALSGEMEQNARNRTLAGFKQGGLRILVATDVAARGIDVQDVARVVHGELPTNPDAYTHRAGRTGRAGRKGTSALLVAPIGVVRATRLLRGLGVDHRFEPIPSAREILRVHDERLYAELTTEPAELEAIDPRWHELTARLIEAGALERTVARLLANAHQGVTAPREVRVFPVRTKSERDSRRDYDAYPARAMPADRKRAQRPKPEFERARSEAPTRAPDAPASRGESVREVGHPRDDRPSRERRPPPERAAPVRERQNAAPLRERSDARSRPREAAPSRPSDGDFTSFHVSWGQRSGADARRLLAVVCRRGKIEGRDVGAIRVETNFSLVQVANAVAPAFARAAARPDPREPEVVIRADLAQAGTDPAVPRDKPRKPFVARGGGDRPLKRRAPKARAH